MGKFTKESLKALASQFFAGCPDFQMNSLVEQAYDFINGIKEQLYEEDITEYVMRGQHFNLPFGLKHDLVERVLYYKGRACVFKNFDGIWYVLPFALAGEIDCKGGRYLDITPLVFGGSDDNKQDKSFLDGLILHPIYDTLIPEQITDEILETGCVIINDRVQRRCQNIIPMAQLQEPLIEYEAMLMALIRTASLNKIGIKGIRVGSPDEGSKIIQASLSKSLYGIIGVTYLPIESNFEKLDLDDTTSVNLQELCMLLQSTDNKRLNNLGILNGGVFEKQGTILETEAKYGTTGTQLIERGYVSQRQDAWNILNSIYGTNAWYEPVTALNLYTPNQDEQNDSTNMMYDNEISQADSSDSSNKVGE